ncbi:DUF1338 domain-containing protein [Parvularcula oceani]|uniref:DUF1338 domain-containing protein n=1 Tax=Parvularcula oceani TaxID=1247963 RepID=UPI0004E12802|nr:DUF1338 domain-containing protein [Parvularcula oceani]
MATPEALFDKLWAQYAKLTPQAQKIRSLLEERGEHVVNDHVAFRTFDDPRLGIDALARPFLELGYSPRDEYRFEQKRLFARYYAHEDPELPKVFISELLLAEFSGKLQETVRELISQLSEEDLQSPDLVTAGRLWNVDTQTYEALYEESEYAGWMAAFGFCANHFTIFVNALKSFDDLPSLAAFIEDAGFRMNRSGGLIKGSPEVLLEQCSTMATEVPTAFTDGDLTIPSCYYEFAKRFAKPDGQLYQGFVAASADKIFESTNR